MRRVTSEFESHPSSTTETLGTRKHQRRQPRTIPGDIVPTSEPQPRCSQDTLTVVTVGSGTVGIPNVVSLMETQTVGQESLSDRWFQSQPR